jgi:hypothetical protein
MAKQKSIIRLEGTIGDITFYKGKTGYLARQASSLNGDLIATDPRFQRTRENNAEFGRAGSAGKLLRKSLRELIQHAKDSTMIGRLTKEMVKVIQADAVSIRGQRNVLDGELELLRGFNFNVNAKLDTLLFMDYVPSINRVSGAFSVEFPMFNPEVSISAPQGSTHCQLVLGGAAIDFEQGLTEFAANRSEYLSLKEATTAVINMSASLSPASTKPLFLAVGVVFYQQINGQYYTLSNGAYNGLSLVLIEGL